MLSSSLQPGTTMSWWKSVNQGESLPITGVMPWRVPRPAPQLCLSFILRHEVYGLASTTVYIYKPKAVVSTGQGLKFPPTVNQNKTPF